MPPAAGHSQGDMFAQPGQLPSPPHLAWPLSLEAHRYCKSGSSFLRRYLPFCIVTLSECLLIMGWTLLALLIPLARFLPPVYQ